MRSDEARRYLEALADEPRPCAFLDLGAFERNAEALFAPCLASGKSLRIATKSLRSVELLERIVALAERAGLATSFMTYSAAETAFLAERGLDDFLLAYPIGTAREADRIAVLAATGARVRVVCDHPSHLELLARAGERAGTVVDVVVELDVAYRPSGLLGSRLHLGVRRSPLREPEDVVSFARRIGDSKHLAFAGLMAYEAQLAGLGDDLPQKPWESRVARLVKRASRAEVSRRREAVVSALRLASLEPRVVNGAGTGSLREAALEPCLTELTAGSGFCCSHLFDRYRSMKLEPAAFFVLDVVRVPGHGFVTCAGGGFVASGAAGADRLPIPYYPSGLSLLPMEGAGEVQTPLKVSVPERVSLTVGDSVIFRHAKAGELAEHVSEYVLVRDGVVEGRASTYRGLGKVFFG
jgi:D-serine deaminase-like pyridoxal phosphate-dependent protein